jgi:ADP-heptose:LPS heptosyltransferase
MSGVTRILVIRFSSIGDIVLTTPVIRALSQQLEGETEIHYLTKKNFKTVLEANPYIHKIHTIEKSVQEVLPDLEKIEFDYIIDLHNNIRSSVTKRRLKSLSFTFRKLNFQKWLWVNFGLNHMPDVHVVDRYMETLKAFSVQDDGKGLDYFIPENTQAITLPETHRSDYIAFAIGAAHVGKKLGNERLEEICKNTSHPIVLLGAGEADELEGKKLASMFPHVFNACGMASLHQSALCIKQARVVITGDTGLMHIASAFGKKIVSLWGCTVPGFGMYPYRPHPSSVMLEPEGRDKRPCSKLGNRCKYGPHSQCIDQISNDAITTAIEKLWAQQTTL